MENTQPTDAELHEMFDNYWVTQGEQQYWHLTKLLEQLIVKRHELLWRGAEWKPCNGEVIWLPQEFWTDPKESVGPKFFTRVNNPEEVLFPGDTGYSILNKELQSIARTEFEVQKELKMLEKIRNVKIAFSW